MAAKKSRVEIELEVASKRAELLDAMLGKLDELEAANRANVAAAEAAAAATARLAAENAKLNLRLEGVKNSLAFQRAEARRLSAEMDKMRQVQTATTAATTRLTEEQAKLALKLDGTRNSLAFQQAETRRLNAEVEKLRGYLGAAAMGLVRLSDTQRAAAASTANSTAKTRENVDAVKGATEGYSLFNVVLRSAAVLAGFRMAQALAEAEMQLTKTRNTLLAVTGTTAAANAELEFLRGEADRLGVSLPGMTAGYAKFKAAVSSSGLPLEEVRRIFTAFTEAGTALGLSSDEMQGVFLSLSQMFSKGTVQAEELRGQLGERLPGAFNDAATAMGMTTAELGKALEQGEILASDLIPKLATLVQEKYGAALPAAMDSTTAAVNRTSSAWFNFKNELGDAGFTASYQTVTNGIGSALDNITNKLRGNREAMRDFTRGLMQSMGSSLIGDAIVARMDLEDSTARMQETLDALNARKAEMGGGTSPAGPSPEAVAAAKTQRELLAEMTKRAATMVETQEKYRAALQATKTGTEQIAMMEARRAEIQVELGKDINLAGLTSEQQRVVMNGWIQKGLELQTEDLKLQKEIGEVKTRQNKEIEKSIKDEVDRINDEREAGEKQLKAENELRQTGLEIARQELAVQRAAIDVNPRLNVDQKQAAKIVLLKAELPLIEARIEALKTEQQLTQGDTTPESLTRRAEVLREINSLQLQYVQGQAEANRLAENFGTKVGNGLMAWANSFGTVADGVAGILTGTLDAAISSIGNNITGLIMGTQTWGEAFANVANQIVAALINTVVQFAVQRAAIWALNKLFGIQELVFVSTQATAAAVAWAPAAIAASIASYGAAAGIGLAAYGSAVAAGTIGAAAGAGAAGAAGIGASAGFRRGGYTGDGPRDEVAGVVHRREVVIPAEITDRLGAANIMSAMESAAYGYAAPAESTAPTVNVTTPGRGGATNFSLGVFDNRAGMDRWMKSREGRRAMMDMDRRNAYKTEI